MGGGMTQHLSEREVQRAVLGTLAQLGFQAFHVPNEVRLSGDKLARLKQAARRKADGVRAGVPDLVLIHHGRVLAANVSSVGFVEVKETGEVNPDPDQEWWRDELGRRGIPWALVNDPAQIIDVLKEWRWLP